MRVKDKVAIVTGSNSGLGKAMAKRLAEEGAAVVITGTKQDNIDKTVAELQAAGHKVMGYKVDVRNREEIKGLMKATADKFGGRIDILVNNAGVTRAKPFLEMGDEDWDYVLDTDLKGVFFCAQGAGPYMMKQNYGKIVNIASVGGAGGAPRTATEGGAATFNYQAAKAGVIQLTRSLARELGDHSINVNCIIVGSVITPITYTSRSKDAAEKHVEARRRAAVLNRTGTPEDIANAVLFLASDEASFISGQSLGVCGGRTDYMR